ncbi:hypothetical protein HGG78_17955 [Vibrio aestuarianus]|uniref:hypothetical protein n=1 Tax=Vibrio aestuarianus TaxID=28171 RepID=UPI00155882A7|nr:hypothetical protein [Vibrio aestuarianus]NGZ15601.1 hypothetical protein [Vibrio aestuarianus]NKZ51749.1 hypothetical protein [Vibrio aestuarianus]
MSKVLDVIVLQAQYFLEVLSSTKGYTQLFKGGIALIITGFVAIQFIFSTALPIEKDAYKLKYEAEFSMQKEFSSFDEMKCKISHDSYSICKLAKYQKSLTSNSIQALYSWLEFVSYLGLMMLALSAIGFIAHPHFHSKQET